MLTDSDVARMDAIMANVLKRREERDFPPDRDEDRIAEILYNAERSAVEEYETWFGPRNQFASPVKFQPTVSESDGGKGFPQIDRYRNFDSEE